MSRFKRLVRKVEAEGESAHEANAVAAIAGRKKYGAKKFAQMGAAGRKKELSLEGETGMLQKYSDEDVVLIMQQLVAEAILEGRLDNVDDDEVAQAQEIGLSLGFVEQDAEGGLELARAATFADRAGALHEYAQNLKKKRMGNPKPLLKAVKPTFGGAVNSGKRILGKLTGLAKKHPLGTLAVGAAGGALLSRRKQQA